MEENKEKNKQINDISICDNSKKYTGALTQEELTEIFLENFQGLVR